MKAVLLLVIISFAFCTALDVEFVGNVTLEGDQDNWKFRLTTLTEWDLDPADGDGVAFTSISFDGTNSSLNGDSVWGRAQIQQSSPPIVWLQYASLDIYYLNDVDAQGSFGLIANAYVRLEETAPNGTIVRVQSLKENFQDALLQWDTEKVGSSEDLKWISFIGDVDGEPWTIKLTFIISNVVGVLNVADAVVTPKSLESIVEINDWEYQDPANTLTLVMAVATGEASVKGTAVVSDNADEEDQVYFSLSKKAVVGGEVTDVSVSGYTKAAFDATFANDQIKAQFTAMFGAKLETQQVKVTFPAGATDITYDPTIGAGYQIDNSAFSLAASSFFAFGIALFVLLL